ncbi:MAG: DUF4097 family beta strand repeat protein [Xanthomonadales bacterium]|nr:DUF4097 family beta strand repeat protein [Xanthomonadales bacterium]
MKTLNNIALALAAVLISAPVLAEDLDITRSVKPDATITVINVAGEIEISTWDRDEVQLTGHTGSNAKLEVTGNEHNLRFEVRQLKSRNRSDESELYLVVPVGASLVAESVSADITITGSRGEQVSAESVSGDVEVLAEAGRVELSSVSGDIVFNGSATRSSGETVSGDIEFHGISGEVSINTVSGDARLEAGRVAVGKFETVSGSLELAMAVEDSGRLTVESMSGDVSLALPSGQAAEFRAQSFSGDIRSRFGRVERGDFGPGSHLKHIEGGGGASIRVESFSGDISIGHR